MEEPGGKNKQIEKRETYKQRKLKLLGHVIRADNPDPMSQVALRESSIKGKEVGKQRVGKPKLDCIREGKKCLGNLQERH